MILGLSFSSKLNKGSFIVHTFKTVSRILRVLVYSMKLLFFLRLCFISINLTFVLAWNTVIMSGLVIAAWMLEKPQRHLCRTVGTPLAASIEPLWHCGLSNLFYRYYLGIWGTIAKQVQILNQNWKIVKSYPIRCSGLEKEPRHKVSSKLWIIID